MALQDVVALPASRVPEPNGRVVAGRGQGAAIGGPGQPYHHTGMSFQRPDAGARFHVPELDRLVGAAAGEQARIRGEGQRDVQVAVPRQFLQQHPPFGVPEPDAGIHAATGEQASIGAAGDSENWPTLRGKTLQGCPGAQVPHMDGSIVAPTDQLPVGPDGKGSDRNVLILSRPDGRSTGHIPEPDGAVPTGGGQSLSIGTEGDGSHAIGMAPYGQVRHAALLAPDMHLPAVAACGNVVLMATARIVSKAEVQTTSCSVAPESRASCISTPCR